MCRDIGRAGLCEARDSLAPNMEIAYVGKDAKKSDVDLAKTTSEFSAAYHRGLLEKAWGEAAFVSNQNDDKAD
jgi:hypothetical protein